MASSSRVSTRPGISLESGGASPGRKKYAEFLRARYNEDVGALNRAYALQVDSFSELENADFSNLDLQRYEIEKDDQAFLGEIAATYYEVIGTGTRRSDSRHLIFGEKYLLGDTPHQVIQAAVPYVDAVAIQPGDGYIPIYTPGDRYPAQTGINRRSGTLWSPSDHCCLSPDTATG